MPAKSKAQQRLFGAALAYKRKEMKKASPRVKKLAKSMSEEKLEEFAHTKRKGLPQHVKDHDKGMRGRIGKALSS